MAHYIGPKARINRRLGFEVYDSSGSQRASHRRIMPPGQIPTRRRRPTDYGRAMAEKQKIRHYFGLSQTQLERFFAMALRKPGNTGDHLKVLCERRLDNVIWRSGFARTRVQARQAVAHGHFKVNGRKCTVPSCLVAVNDQIQVRGAENLQKLYKSLREQISRPEVAFCAVEDKELLIKVVREPDKNDFSLPVNINPVVELLNR